MYTAGRHVRKSKSEINYTYIGTVTFSHCIDKTLETKKVTNDALLIKNEFFKEHLM